MRILAIESSCDETAAAVVEDGRRVLSSVIASQVQEHIIYGGVVPEIASRRHTEAISGVVSEALSRADMTVEQVDAIAVTYAPGLIGALLVGVNFAKGLAYAAEKPLVPVHHLRSHIAANYITHTKLCPPFLCLVVSGGHSHIIEVRDYTDFHVIGRTRDDAAGEAMDKAARAMGLDYPGGVNLDRVSKNGNPKSYKLPHPRVDGSEYDFSFSGLKTAVINLIHNTEQRGEELDINSLAACFQKTVSGILTDKFIGAAREFDCKKIALAGGVAANGGLRETLQAAADKNGMELFSPPISLCSDNAAMIARQAFYEYRAGKIAGTDLNAYATMRLDNVIW